MGCPDCHADSRHNPDSSGRGQPVHILSFGPPHDHAGPDEPDAGRHPLQNPSGRGRITRAQEQRDDREQRPAECHERVRPQTGRLPLAFAVDADGRAKERGHQPTSDDFQRGLRDRDGVHVVGTTIVV